MQVSLNWLGEYLNLSDLSPEAIAESLTDLGLEVEAINEVAPLKGDIVVGEIIEAGPHPGADSLQLTQVQVGDDEPLRIVCGAANARVGIKVAVAKIGAVLPGDFKIKPSKIRGEKSFGMLCSSVELGVGSDDSGIMELEQDLPLGQSIAEIYQLNDTVFEIGLTPNRPDCLGHLGIARELAAKLQREWSVPDVRPERDSQLHSGDHIKVTIEDEQGCGRFVALVVKGVKNVSSPLWMSRRLEACGVRSLNLLVDATNYAMLEYGQPNHAYDSTGIVGNHITVRCAASGEKLTTLDEKEHALEQSDLVIADAKGAIGLAGVMGGATSEVKDSTTDLVIEAAHFHPSRVRKMSKYHGMHTDASHRFERGSNIHLPDTVALRVAELIQLGMKSQGLPIPSIACDSVDIWPFQPKLPRIALRPSRLRSVLGTQIADAETIKQALGSLGFTFLDSSDDRLLFEVPGYRLDIHREVDLIEEYGRLKGYDKLPYTLPAMSIEPVEEDPFVEFCERTKVAAAGCGLHEIITFPFMSQQSLVTLGLDESSLPFGRKVALTNPLAEDQKYLASTLVPGLLQAAQANQARGEQGLRLFQQARVFMGKPETDESFDGYAGIFNRQGRHVYGRALEDKRPYERMVLGGVLTSPWIAKAWDGPEQAVGFYHAKGIVLNFLNQFGVREVECHSDTGLPWLNPTAAAQLFHKPTQSWLGYLGVIHPRTAGCYDFDLEKPPVVFELDLEQVMAAVNEQHQVVAEYNFPKVSRDLAFEVADTVRHQDFNDALGGFKRRNLQSWHLFDVYTGQPLAEGRKSMAYRFDFRSAKKTLTDKEVDKEIENLKRHLNNAISAEQR